VIALVRHPPVAGAGRCYGRTDLPLADPQSAVALAARLAPLGGIVWTSPATRCRAVAEALGAYRVDDRLQELDFGAWENRPWDEVPRAALDCWAADPWGFTPPGGETGSALVARVTAFCDALPDGTHVVITHGGPLKVLTLVLQGRPVDLLAAAPAPGSIQMLGASEPEETPSPSGRGSG
jgi:alpha-ribazole phosphatase